MKRVLLDTNAYTGFLNGDRQLFDVITGCDEILMAVFVLGELNYGFKNGIREMENREILDKFLARPSVKISIPTVDCAEIFGRIKVELKKKGSPVPVNDVWIAAAAMETGSYLISYDKHFKEIPGLLLWNPLVDN